MLRARKRHKVKTLIMIIHVNFVTQQREDQAAAILIKKIVQKKRPGFYQEMNLTRTVKYLVVQHIMF